VGGQYEAARSVAEEILRRAEQEGDSGLVLIGHRTLGVTLYMQGELEPARGHLEQALALYAPEAHRALAMRFGQDPRSACQAMLTPVLWLLGFPEQAARCGEQALASARAREHFNTLAYAVYFGSVTPALFRRDFVTLEGHARALKDIAEAQGAVFWVAGAAIGEGLTEIQRGDTERGLARFAEARAGWRATGTSFNDPLFVAALADLHLQGGRLDDGLTTIGEALRLAHGSGELCWEAEMHRVRGELLLAAGGPGAAEGEACLVRALECARRQAARSLELRAAISLGRLWQRRGERRAAVDLVAPVYGWFSEGLDTADLTDARTWLDGLA